MNNEMNIKLLQLRAEQESEIQKKRSDMEIQILEIQRKIQLELKHQMFLDERKSKINKIKEKINN